MGRLKEYVDANRIGESPVTPLSFRADDLLAGLERAAVNFGSRFVLPGMNLVIDRERCRK